MLIFDLKLGPAYTGLAPDGPTEDADMKAEVTAVGDGTVLETVTTGFREVASGSGDYEFEYSGTVIDDSFNGTVTFKLTDGTYLSSSKVEDLETVNESVATEIWTNPFRTLTSGVNVVVAPWQTGSLTIIKGDSYLDADDTAIVITKAADSVWPSDLATGGYTITFTCTPTDKTLHDESGAVGFTTTTGTVLSASSVQLGDMAATTTNGLTIPKNNGTNAYTYEVIASRSGGTISHRLERGKLSAG